MQLKNFAAVKTDQGIYAQFSLDDLAEELTRVSEEDLNKVKQLFRENNRTSLISANIRNILFCGASRSGKTTTYHVLMDPCYCPMKSSMFSETMDTVFRSFSLKDNINNNVHEFVLSLIDSPGTFEIRSSDDEFEGRSNEAIKELIVDCLNHQVVFLNLVILFMSIGAAVGTRDIESVKLFMDMFGGNGMPVILCITHADGYSEHKRQIVLQEIQKHPDLKPYFDNKQLEILFMGCVDYIHNDFYDVKVVAQKYREVYRWREALIDRIFRAEQRFELSETNIYKDAKRSIKDLLKECTVDLKKLCSLDEDLGEFLSILDVNMANMELLYKNKMMLEDAGLQVETETFWDLLQTVKKNKKFTEMTRKKMIHPWSLN